MDTAGTPLSPIERFRLAMGGRQHHGRRRHGRVSADYAVSMARRGCQWLQVGGEYGYLVWAADTLKAAIAGRKISEGR